MHGHRPDPTADVRIVNVQEGRVPTSVLTGPQAGAPERAVEASRRGDDQAPFGACSLGVLFPIVMTMSVLIVGSAFVVTVTPNVRSR